MNCDTNKLVGIEMLRQAANGYNHVNNCALCEAAGLLDSEECSEACKNIDKDNYNYCDDVIAKSLKIILEQIELDMKNFALSCKDKDKERKAVTDEVNKNITCCENCVWYKDGECHASKPKAYVVNGLMCAFPMVKHDDYCPHFED